MTASATEIAVRLDGISKQYHLGTKQRSQSLYDRIGALLGQPSQAPDELNETIWALRDVSFEVPRGHVLGIVGRNGSGKSTLMKVLARVTAPTTGTAEVRGRVGALLSVGTGFHPELSGRENIDMSGAILGMSKADIAAVRDRIVEFSEIGKYLDTPVKYYSSGMFMRLAFSVVAHLRAEVMLVDEVLAVGDMAFQLKCLSHIRELVREGRTVLFVSHTMESVRALCDSAIVLEQGVMRFQGDVDDAIDFYVERMSGMPARLWAAAEHDEILVPSHAARIDRHDIDVG